MISLENTLYDRTALLLGERAMERVAHQRVILFGVGGVGSWCAESLVRSGVHHLTLVDNDRVNPSNLNRQLQATTHTIGQLKVEALRERLLTINPEAEITAITDIYNAENADSFHLETYDVVIDAIDSLTPKAHLILHATNLPVLFFSSMGSALKTDPTKIKVDEFWKITYCPLARALRKKFKHWQKFPARKFLCVHSSEVLPNMGESATTETGPDEFHKVQVNGTIAHITAIFGFMLAGLAIRSVISDV